MYGASSTQRNLGYCYLEEGSIFTVLWFSISVLLFSAYFGNSFSFFDSASQ